MIVLNHDHQRRPQHEPVDPHLLRGDPRLGFLELSPALLVVPLRRVAFAAVGLGAGEIALQLLVVELELVQHAAFLRIVLAAENLAGLDVLSLAIAHLDQTAALQRHHLGPARRLHYSGAIDGLGDGSLRRDAGRDRLDRKDVGVGVIRAATYRGHQRGQT